MKGKIVLGVFLSSILILYALSILYADTIELKSGKIVEGKIVERTDKYIKVDIGIGMPITYFLDEIEGIDGGQIKISEALVDKNVSPDEADPQKILKQVLENYLTMKNYSSKVKITHIGSVMDMEVVGESHGLIQLSKPNYYKIKLSESQKTGDSIREVTTAIWNAGSGPHHYHGELNAYSKVKDDIFALRIATTVASFNKIGIVRMFFDFMQDHNALSKYLSEIKNLKMLGEEIIDNEACYIIEGDIGGMLVKYWISKERNLIMKQYRQGGILAVGNQPMSREMKQMIDSIRSSGNDNPKVTCEYSNIQTDIEKKVSEFSFAAPKGARLSEDIFAEIIAHRLFNR